MANTPFLDMDMPVATETPGPSYASKLVIAITDRIDPHQHTGSGDGKKIPSQALDIDADVEFNNYRATEVKAVTFQEQTVDETNNNSVYIKDDELYAKDGAGNVVQITDGGQLAVAAAGGGFGGDYGQPGILATATYSDATKTFVFSQEAGIRAKMAQGPTLITEDIASGNGILIQAPASLSAGYDWIYPDALPSIHSPLQIDSSGQIEVANPTPYHLINVGLAASIASNNLTVELKQYDGSTDPSTGNGACRIGFRSSTLTLGNTTERLATGALSIVIPSGSTLGFNTGYEDYVYVYALDNSGTIELAVSSSSVWGTHNRVSTTLLDASSDNAGDIYSSTARANVPIRLLGRISVSISSGNWSITPTLVEILPEAPRDLRYTSLGFLLPDIKSHFGVCYITDDGDFNITLPGGVPQGFFFYAKKRSGATGTTTIVREIGTEEINGVAADFVISAGSSYLFLSRGVAGDFETF